MMAFGLESRSQRSQQNSQTVARFPRWIGMEGQCDRMRLCVCTNLPKKIPSYVVYANRGRTQSQRSHRASMAAQCPRSEPVERVSPAPVSPCDPTPAFNITKGSTTNA